MANTTGTAPADTPDGRMQLLFQEACRLAKLGYWEAYPDGRPVHWSPEVYTLHGVPYGQLITTEEAIRFYAAEYRERVEACVAQALRSGEDYVFEAEIITTSGDRRWVRSRGRALLASDGNLVSIHGFIQCIDEERAQQEREIKADRLRQLNAIATSLPGVLLHLSVDREGSLTCHYCSPNAEQVLGMSADDLHNCGNLLSDRLHPDDRATLEQIANEPTTHLARSLSLRLHLPGSGYRWLDFTTAVSRIPEGGCDLHGYIHDANERKSYEQALLLSEQRYRSIAEDSPLMICSYKPGFTITYANQAFCDHFQRDNTSLIGSSFLDLIPEAEQERVCRVIESITPIAPIQQTIITDQGTDGEIRWLRWTDRGLFTTGGDLRGYHSVGEDISELKRIEHDLRQTNEQLVSATRQANSANEAKSIFLAHMSHEIRTPLNGIMGFADLLSDSPLNGEQRDQLAIIQRCGQALLTVINDVLDFSKIEAGHLQLESIPFDLHQLVDDVIALARASGQGKGIEVHHAIAEGVPRRCIGDGVRLRQVLGNLCNNAVKFTDMGEVHLAIQLATADTHSCQLTMVLRDTGIGMDDQQLARIFEPFFQADGSISRKYGGTGLGLAISRKLVDLLGGSIAVSSNPGGGTTFTIAIGFGIPTEGKHEGAQQRQEPPQLDMQVLVAEDNPVNQLLISSLLSKVSARATVVADGAACVAAAADQDWDLILMDIEMPVLNGISAAREIRERERAQGRRRTPIIALTAHIGDSLQAACAAAGMDDHVHKPLSQQSFYDLLQRWHGRCAGDDSDGAIVST